MAAISASFTNTVSLTEEKQAEQNADFLPRVCHNQSVITFATSHLTCSSVALSGIVNAISTGEEVFLKDHLGAFMLQQLKKVSTVDEMHLPREDRPEEKAIIAMISKESYLIYVCASEL